MLLGSDEQQKKRFKCQASKMRNARANVPRFGISSTSATFGNLERRGNNAICKSDIHSFRRGSSAPKPKKGWLCHWFRWGTSFKSDLKRNVCSSQFCFGAFAFCKLKSTFHSWWNIFKTWSWIGPPARPLVRPDLHSGCLFWNGRG